MVDKKQEEEIAESKVREYSRRQLEKSWKGFLIELVGGTFF